MSKLNPEKQYIVSKETLALILVRYGIGDFVFEPIHAGIENTSARIESGGKKYVLRIYKNSGKTDQEIQLELAFQDYLRENGIPIPLLYKNSSGSELTIEENESGRWQAILMEFAEGTSSTPYTPELVDELSTLQARMHLLGEAFSRDNPKGLPWERLHLKLVPMIDTEKHSSELQGFIQRITNFSYPLPAGLPYGYNHRDLDLEGNVIIKDNRIGAIIDFDDVKYSPIVDCLAKTVWSVLFDYGEEHMWRYLSNYEKIRPLTPIERKVLPHA